MYRGTINTHHLRLQRLGFYIIRKISFEKNTFNLNMEKVNLFMELSITLKDKV